MKNLIMGFGTNQTPESVEVFLRSARSVYSEEQADIALITNSVEGFEGIIRETGCIALNTPSTYAMTTTKISKAFNRLVLHVLRLGRGAGMFRSTPEIGEGYLDLLEIWHHPQIARWYAYRRLLNFLRDYRYVLLSDVKDVVFQRPVFDMLTPGSVYLFEDGEPFKGGKYNREWYISAYGQKAYDRIADRTPICIGVVMGDLASMRSMVEEFSQFFSRAPFGKIEQATFNHMVLTGLFETPLTVVPNYRGGVATLAEPGVREATRLDGQEIVGTDGGAAFPVVHMYDRYSDYKEAVRARYLTPLSG
jgi:hypothetical protein